MLYPIELRPQKQKTQVYYYRFSNSWFMQSSQSASRSSSAFLNLCPCFRHVRICSFKSHRLTYISRDLWHISNSSRSSGRSNSSRAFIVWICFKMCRIYVDLSDRLLPSSNKNSIKEKGYYCLVEDVTSWGVNS